MSEAVPQNGSTIKGYRQLQPSEIEMMNTLKEMSRKFLEKLDAIHGAHDTQADDHRWLAVARTHMQQACMAACRAVAKPDNNC